MDYLGTTLTILKFLGIVVSGAGAIFSTLQETSTTKSKQKKLKSQRNALRWAAIGLVVAILSQFFETMNSAKEATEARIKDQANQLEASNQLSLARSSVEQLQKQNRVMQKEMIYIEHVLGELNTLSVTLECELSPTNPVTRILLDRMEDLTPIDSTIIFQSLSDSDLNSDILSRQQIRDEKSTVWSQNVVGYVNLGSSSNLSKIPIQTFYSEVCSTNWLAVISSNTDLSQTVQFINSPKPIFQLFSKETKNSTFSSPDFFTDLSSVSDFSVGFDLVSENILLKWTFDFPNSAWRQNVRMGSVRDLDGATFCLSFSNLPPLLNNEMKMTGAKLNFNGITIHIPAFEVDENNPNISETNKTKIYTAVLPAPLFRSAEEENAETTTASDQFTDDDTNLIRYRYTSSKWVMFSSKDGSNLINPEDSNFVVAEDSVLASNGVSIKMTYKSSSNSNVRVAFKSQTPATDEQEMQKEREAHERYIQETYNNPNYYFNRAIILLKFNHFLSVIHNLNRAIELDTNFLEAYEIRGDAEYYLGDYSGCKSDCDRIIQSNPTNSSIFFNRGTAEYSLSEYEAAKTDFTHTIKLDPTFADAYYNRGLTELQLKEKTEAKKDFKKVDQLKLKTNSP